MYSSGNAVFIPDADVRVKYCKGSSVMLRSHDGWKFFHPKSMTAWAEGVVIIRYGIGWQFFVSRSEKQADGTWKDVDSRTIGAGELAKLFDGRETLHHPDPLPSHVDVTIPEELIDD